MAKDRKARRQNEVTVTALANMLAALVDAMIEANVPNSVVHNFLDKLGTMNAITLSGMAGQIMGDFVHIVRGTVPGND